jgi:transcriptional regulator with XRE-family HTH domain
MNNLQRALKNFREKHNMNQNELADMLGVTRESLANWEIGRSKPRADMYSLLSKILEVSIDYLLGNTNVASSQNQPQTNVDDFSFALYGEVNELSDEQKDDVLKFVEFLKSKDKKEKK